MSATIVLFDLTNLPAIPDENTAVLQLLSKAIEDRAERGESTEDNGAATSPIQAVLDGLIEEFGTINDPKGERVWMTWWPRVMLDGRYLVLDIDFDALPNVLSRAELLCRTNNVLLADLQQSDSVVFAPKHAVFGGDSGVAALRKALGVIESSSESEVVQRIADLARLENRDVSTMFDAMLTVALEEFGTGGSGKLKLPHIGTLTCTKLPPVPAKTSTNPFTMEMMELKAKPGRVVVKMSVHPELHSRLVSEIEAK